MTDIRRMPADQPGHQLSSRNGGRLISAARIVLILIALLVLGLFISGIPARFTQTLSNVERLSLQVLGLSAGSYGGIVLVVDLLVVLAHIGIAAVILWRRPDDWLALFVALTLVLNGGSLPIAAVAAGAELHPLWVFLERSVVYLGLLSGVVLLYVFPDGRFVPPWTRLLTVIWAAFTLLVMFFPDSSLSLASWPVYLQFLVLLAWSGIAISVQVYRYQNVSGPVQRQQTKWALLGLVAAVGAPIVLLIQPETGAQTSAVSNLLYQRVGSGFFTMSFLTDLSSSTFFRLGSMIFPVSFAIAILRYRLWDIDVLINRTLVYGTLTGVLLLIYFLSVFVFESLFQLVLGQGEFAVVASTLAIAAVFNPLRGRVQAFIDRSFYRHKYDALQTLANFSTGLRDEVDMNQLCEMLEEVVNETMQPETVWLWMKE
ncbi:MAG TPA: hypothetical protein VLA49_06670 [Anaerolineales bacterium]|nr:hypothetical protein [Anaerolineales bacterium]